MFYIQPRMGIEGIYVKSEEENCRYQVAILIPCYNEEKTVGKVIEEFHAALPQASIYVCDNNSNDETKSIARTAGAIVSVESLRGKGNVVRRMFADIDADVYVLVDGDGTYQASSAPILIRQLIDEQLDIVVLPIYQAAAN